jgi:flagellar protein FlaG
MNIAATLSLPPVRPAERSVQRAVDTVSRMLSPLARGLEFSTDGATGETVVRVVDTATREVVRQIPSPEILAIARALDRMQGLFISEQA